MNTKRLLFIAGLCGTTWVGSALAQSGGGAGAGGAGASGAAAGAGTGSSASGPSANATPGANAGNTATTRAGAMPGTPNMNSSMPSRSVLNTSKAPGSTPTDGSNLPPGLTVPPPKPGVSPISGLPTSDIPAVSAGTAPIGPQSAAAVTTATGAAAAANSGANAAGVAPRTSATTTADSVGAAGDVQSTPAPVGTGVTRTVPTPPPAANPEITPAAPVNDMGQVWVAGHYSWDGAQWSWIDGGWQRPPHDNASWVPGHYDASSKQWTEGHWGVGSNNSTRRATESTAPQR